MSVNLDECGDMTVCRQEIYSVYGPRQGVYLQDHTCSDSVGLLPAQALALLAWLEQEKAILEGLVDEVKGEPSQKETSA